MTIEHTYNASLRCRKLIGTTAQWVVDPAINIDVTVLDVGNMFGNIRFLIMPIAGIGKKWVDKKYMIFQAGEAGVSGELLDATQLRVSMIDVDIVTNSLLSRSSISTQTFASGA